MPGQRHDLNKCTLQVCGTTSSASSSPDRPPTCGFRVGPRGFEPRTCGLRVWSEVAGQGVVRALSCASASQGNASFPIVSRSFTGMTRGAGRVARCHIDRSCAAQGVTSEREVVAEAIEVWHEI